MNRRTILTSALPAFGMSLAGCAAPSTDPPENRSDPDKNQSDPGRTPSDPPNLTFSAPDFTESRVDEPPYPITVPPSDAKDKWNADYLGTNMDGESELSFERIEGVEFADRQVWPPADEESRFIATATVLTSQADEQEMFEQFDANIDYGQSFLVAVESGYGSGSVHHRWKRVEAFPSGIHLYGYYVRPYLQTSDYTSHQSVIRVERPSDVEQDSAKPEARVSLTISADSRVHFSSQEGVIGVRNDEGADAEHGG